MKIEAPLETWNRIAFRGNGCRLQWFLQNENLGAKESFSAIFQKITQKKIMRKGFLSVPADRPTVVRR